VIGFDVLDDCRWASGAGGPIVSEVVEAGIAMHHEEARPMRDELSYFQAIQTNLKKYTVGGTGKTEDDLNAAIRQIVSEAVASEGVVDIFGAAGLKKPDISVLSDKFLEDLKDSPYENLQLEVLKKLLNDESIGGSGCVLAQGPSMGIA
jgi:type I restriction enzyme R subunit